MQFIGPFAGFCSTESSKIRKGPMKRAFALGIALVVVAVYLGVAVTIGEEYLHADWSLGIPAVARTFIAFLSGLAASIIFLGSDDFADARRPKIILAIGILLLLLGSYFGLFVAPPE